MKPRSRGVTSVSRPWLFAFLVLLPILATEQIIEVLARERALNQERTDILTELTTLRAHLEGFVNAHLLLVHGLTAVIASHPDLNQAEFARIAQGLVNEHHALRNIAGAPDLVIKLMYPLAGNEAALGLDYRTHPQQGEAALRIMASGQPGLTGPLPLLQGGLGFVIRSPVFVTPAQPDGALRPWGLVAAVIDIVTFYERAGILDAQRRFQLALRGTDESGAEGPVFFGDPRLLIQEPVTLPVSLPGGSWQLAAIPAGGWGQSFAQLRLIRWLGILIALAVAGMTYSLARANRELAVSEGRLRSLLDTIPDLVWLKDPAGFYLACNPPFGQLNGTTEAEMLGKRDPDFVSAEVAEFFRAKDLAALAADGPSLNEEWLTSVSDGRRRLFETIKTPMRDAQGGVLGVLGIARDITARKEAEEHIRGLNRVHAVLSGISAAIVRLRDSDALFSEVCRIAVEVGGFRMAWLGLADAADGEIRLVAHAGQMDGYLVQLHLSPTDDARAPGPTDLALHQGQHVVCNDIATDPRLAPWREGALARDYRALAAFPITVAGRMRGTFNLYADRTNYFDTAEINLLDELASNIGHALGSIESDKTRESLGRRLIELLESMSDGFVSLGRDWRYQYVNRQAAALFGREPADLLDRHIWAEYPEGVGQPFYSAYERAMNEGVAIRLEDYYSPRQRWFENRIFPTQDGISVFFSDITDHKEAQRALPRQRDILDRSSRFAKVGGWEFEVATGAGTWTEETARIYGLDSTGPSRATTALAAFARPARRVLVPALRAAITEGRPFELELPITSVDGTSKWVHMIGLPVREAGRVVRVEGAIQDISLRKEAELTARQRESLLTTVFQVLPDLFFLMDTDGTIRDYRASRIDDLYLPPDRFLGQRMQEILPPPAAELFKDNLARLAGGGKVISYEYALPMAGNIRYYEARLSQLPETTQVITVVRDITERKRIENEVLQLNAELEERVQTRTAELAAINQELETFTYSVSHDLKAPLRGIDGYSRLLLEDHLGQLDEEGQLFLRNVRQGVEKMSQLIEDLLAYSRMERRGLHGIPVELATLMGRILAERAEDIQANGAQVRVELADLVARADPDGLAMVLRNLLDNALKFRHPDRPPRVEIRGQATGDLIQLAIQDQGIGFDMRFHDRIFEIFQRLQRAEDYPGTGIGLAIVRKAMQRMGGRIWAESTPGQGTTFFLELPQ